MGHIVQAHCQVGLFSIQSIYGLRLSSRNFFKTNIQSCLSPNFRFHLCLFGLLASIFSP